MIPRLLILICAVFFGCRTVSEKEEGAILAYNRGNILREAGDREGAGLAYREALSIKPDMNMAIFNLALLEAELGHHQEALELLESLHNRAPYNITVLRALGGTAWKAGDAEASLAYYRQALAVFEADRRSLDGIASVLEALGRAEEALPYRREYDYLENTPASQMILADTLAAAGLAEEAMEVYENALAGDPGNVEGREAAARLAEELEEWESALRHWSLLAESDVSAYWNLTRLYFGVMGDYNAGLETLRIAVTVPDQEAADALMKAAPPALRTSIRAVLDSDGNMETQKDSKIQLPTRE